MTRTPPCRRQRASWRRSYAVSTACRPLARRPFPSSQRAPTPPLPHLATALPRLSHGHLRTAVAQRSRARRHLAARQRSRASRAACSRLQRPTSTHIAVRSTARSKLYNRSCRAVSVATSRFDTTICWAAPVPVRHPSHSRAITCPTAAVASSRDSITQTRHHRRARRVSHRGQ